jgi:hypothetical protein
LRARRVGKIPDRFQADHAGNLIAPFLAPARVNETAHLLRLEIRRLLVHESDEAKGVPAGFSRKPAGQRQQRSDPAAVVIRARAAKDGIVVRANDNDLRASARNLHLNIVTGLSGHVVSDPPWLKPGPGKGSFDELSRRGELRISQNVPFTDLAGERLHVGGQFRAKRHLRL